MRNVYGEKPILREAIEETLAYDPGAHAERLAQNGEPTISTSMGLHRAHNSMKAVLLRLANDTNSWNQTLQQWVYTVENSLEFKLILEEPIPETGDKVRVWWRDGVLLFCDSYYGDTVVNSSTAYFQYEGPPEGLTRVSAAPLPLPNQYSCSVDAREGLGLALYKAGEAGKILPVWEGRQFLYLVSYKESKDSDFSYRDITAARVRRLPVEIQQAIQAYSSPVN
jgi:hypothetical protein